MPTSAYPLWDVSAGLVKHLTAVGDGWFVVHFAQSRDPYLFVEPRRTHTSSSDVDDR